MWNERQRKEEVEGAKLMRNPASFNTGKSKINFEDLYYSFVLLESEREEKYPVNFDRGRWNFADGYYC